MVACRSPIRSTRICTSTAADNDEWPRGRSRSMPQWCTIATRHCSLSSMAPAAARYCAMSSSLLSLPTRLRFSVSINTAPGFMSRRSVRSSYAPAASHRPWLLAHSFTHLLPTCVATLDALFGILGTGRPAALKAERSPGLGRQERRRASCSGSKEVSSELLGLPAACPAVTTAPPSARIWCGSGAVAGTRGISARSSPMRQNLAM